MLIAASSLHKNLTPSKGCGEPLPYGTTWFPSGGFFTAVSLGQHNDRASNRGGFGNHGTTITRWTLQHRWGAGTRTIVT